MIKVYESFDEMEESGLLRNILQQIRPTLVHMKYTHDLKYLRKTDLLVFQWKDKTRTTVNYIDVIGFEKLITDYCYIFICLGKKIKPAFCTTTKEKM